MLKPFQVVSDYVPAGLDATKWPQLEPLYRGLIERTLKCKNCLERLILDRSELDAAASEASSVLYINMTCHTEDEAVKKAYLDFVEEVEPNLKRLGFTIDQKIVASPFVKDLDLQRYEVLLRDLRAAVEIFRPENVPIETELTKLSQRYSEISGAMMILFRGEERTLPQMARFQEETVRATREEAWRSVAKRRLADKDTIEDIFDQMLALRHQVAVNAGFSNYRDYAFKAKRRFDYTPEDCHSFARGCAEHIVPALRRLNEQRRTGLDLLTLRPWDLAVDAKSRGPLRPFENAQDMVEKTARVFNRMDPASNGNGVPSLSQMFAVLQGQGAAPGQPPVNCLDLDSRKGKAPGGYQASRDRMRMPFIFMNAAGVQRDVETMVHEAGHAFHSMLSRQDPILAYRSEIPLEFAEVASMSMELTTHPYMEEFYGSKENADRARRVHLEQLATMLPWIATIDQFQHWLYTNVGHTRAQRRELWVVLMQRFGSSVEWTGLEEELACIWHRQLHLFGAPFYYIEYGIAQLGALQLYNNFRRAPARAIADYKKSLSLGGSRPLKELFTEAGLDFDFSPERIRKTWVEVESVLASLPA